MISLKIFLTLLLITIVYTKIYALEIAFSAKDWYETVAAILISATLISSMVAIWRAIP